MLDHSRTHSKLYHYTKFLIYIVTSDLGESVHRRSVERALIERKAAVHTAEQAIWAQSEMDKENALKKLHTKMEADHEKRVKSLLKHHKEELQVGLKRYRKKMYMDYDP